MVLTSAHRNDLSTSIICTTFQKYSKEQKKLLKFNEITKVQWKAHEEYYNKR